MSIFSRFRDIVSSNLNAMLDSAENPEKMIKLMISEIENTLIELKASCAKVMADSKRVKRMAGEALEKADYWEEKAALAVSKGRDDLAREALLEKRKYTHRNDSFMAEIKELGLIISKYQDDILQLEEKLENTREKQRVLIQRHIQADHQINARNSAREMESSYTINRFDRFENRIERMEAEAELAGPGSSSLEKKIENLKRDDEIEKELDKLKSRKDKE